MKLLRHIGIPALCVAISPLLSGAASIGSVAIQPNVVPSNTSTNVTISAQITDSSLIPNSVNLIEVNGQGSSIILGQLHDDGKNGDAVAGDKIFTLVQPFVLPLGQVQLQISAAFAGTLRRVVTPSLPILSLAAPPTFTVNPGPLAVGGPFALNNFQSNYQQGAVLPPGGAEIDVTSISLPPPPLSNFVALEVEGSTVTSTTTQVVSGISCTQVFYTDAYTATLTYKNEAVYCPSGKSLYQFYLSYRAGDPNEGQFLSSFQQVLSSAKLTP